MGPNWPCDGRFALATRGQLGFSSPFVIRRKDKAFTAANKTSVFEQAVGVVARQTRPSTPRQVAAVCRVARTHAHTHSRSAPTFPASHLLLSRGNFSQRSSSRFLILTPTSNRRRCAPAGLYRRRPNSTWPHLGSEVLFALACRVE